MYARAQLLTLGTAGIEMGKTLCLGCCCVHCRTFNSSLTSAHEMSEALATPVMSRKDASRHFQSCPLRVWLSGVANENSLPS